jgi:hypothetical protein
LFDSMMFLGTPLIGEADQVAAILADMYKAGLDGAVFMFPDYIDDQLVMGHKSCRGFASWSGARKSVVRQLSEELSCCRLSASITKLSLVPRRSC